MFNVFVLQHVHSTRDEVDEVKFIGVYSTLEKARSAIERLKITPGFSETPDGFHVDEYRVDQDQWVEGYVTFADA